MLGKGQIVELVSGNRVRVGSLLDTGGEAVVYKVVELGSGQHRALKVFNDHSPARIRRTQFLVAQRLGKTCAFFCAPTDWVNNGCVGHLAPLAPGDSLETYLETPGNLFFENIKLAIAISHGVAVLASAQIAHGDIHLTNFRVVRTTRGVEVYFFDFDNFSAPGAPPPLAVGQEHVMAPELRQALRNARPAVPDEFSDRYALTVVLHDIIMAKHVASGFDDDPDKFERCMLSGRWVHDPVVTNPSLAVAEGYPSRMLNADLSRLFRRGLGLEREDRPSAAECRDVLSRNYRLIYIHPPCQGPIFIDPGQTHCPFCNRRFPVLKLVFPSLRKELVCDSAAMPIGRATLLSPKVSAHHAVVRKMGPEVTVESFGRNGTYRWTGTSWEPFGSGPIQGGDRLRFADIEAHVVEVPL